MDLFYGLLTLTLVVATPFVMVYLLTHCTDDDGN